MVQDSALTRPARRFSHILPRNIRSRLPFFIALFFIQTLLTVLFFSAATDTHTAHSLIFDRYDYDMEFHSLSQGQYAALYNQCGEEPGEDHPSLPYEKIQYEENADGSYNAYVTLRGASLDDAYADFLARYLAPLGETAAVTYFASPRMNYQTTYVSEIRGFTIVSTLLILLLSVFLLTELYRMRLNHETFDFGIYMTCGATFGKLFAVAVKEMLSVAALTLLPALLVGNLLSILLFSWRGTAFHFSFTALVGVPLFALLITLISVYMPIKRLSHKAPVQLLLARDNSSLVTSPRASFRIFGKKFPDHYELISLWRYRRYLAWVLFSTIVFPILFVCTSSFADIWRTRAEAEVPDFTVQLNPKTINAELLNESTADIAKELTSTVGIARCLPTEIRQSAAGVRSFLLLTPNQTTNAGAQTILYTGNSQTEVDPSFSRATNLFRFTALDSAAIEALQAHVSDIDGDLTSVLQDDHTIVISESINNTKHFHFSVGDTVMLCTEAHGDVGFTSTSELDNLRLSMEGGAFCFDIYTVGAVIHDDASDARLMVGMGFSSYELFTGQTPYRTAVDVYLDQNLPDFDAWNVVARDVYTTANEYYNCTVTDHHVFFSRHLNSFKNQEGRIMAFAIAFLFMTPLICFFSQNVFYGKRDAEWEMLRAVGATEGEVRRGFLFSGIVTALLTFVIALPIGLFANWLLFKMWNEWLPAGAFVTSVLLRYSIPWGKIIFMWILSLLCGLLPPMVAYVRRLRRIRTCPDILMQGE